MGYLEKKMLKIYEQSQNVYENKQTWTNTDEKSGIYVEVMHFCKRRGFFVTICPL